MWWWVLRRTNGLPSGKPTSRQHWRSTEARSSSWFDCVCAFALRIGSTDVCARCRSAVEQDTRRRAAGGGCEGSARVTCDGGARHNCSRRGAGCDGQQGRSQHPAEIRRQVRPRACYNLRRVTDHGCWWPSQHVVLRVFSPRRQALARGGTQFGLREHPQ